MAWERVQALRLARARTRARGDDDSLWSRWGTGSSARAPPSSVECLDVTLHCDDALISPCARKFESGGEGVSPVIETATTRAARDQTEGAGGVFWRSRYDARRDATHGARDASRRRVPGSSANGHLAREVIPEEGRRGSRASRSGRDRAAISREGRHARTRECWSRRAAKKCRCCLEGASAVATRGVRAHRGDESTVGDVRQRRAFRIRGTFKPHQSARAAPISLWSFHGGRRRQVRT